MASAKSAIQEGKRLHRALVSYAQAVSRDLKMPFMEAIKAMRADAANVAKDLGCSPAFVTVWTEAEINASERLARAKR